MDNSGFDTFQRLAEMADDAQRFRFPVLVDYPEKIAAHREELAAIAERDIKAKRIEFEVKKQSLSQMQSEMQCLDGFSGFMASMTSKYTQIEEDYDEIMKFGNKYLDIPAANIGKVVKFKTKEDDVQSDEKELSENCSFPAYENIREPKLEDYPFSDLTMKYLKAAEAGQNVTSMPLSLPTPRKVACTPNPHHRSYMLHQNLMATPSGMWNKGLFVTPGVFDKTKPSIKPVMSASSTITTPEEPVLSIEQWTSTTVKDLLLDNVKTFEVIRRKSKLYIVVIVFMVLVQKMKMTNLQSPVSPELTSRFCWSMAE